MEHSYFTRNKDFEPQLNNEIRSDLGIVVVIPSYNEPNLTPTLESLMKCIPPIASVEVLVVVNYPVDSDNEVKANALECVRLVKEANRKVNNPSFRFYPIEAYDLPKKHAGVGLARKIGMDEAAWRLMKSECENRIIACFDADSTCKEDYLTEVEKLWKRNPKTTACSIRYEHPLEGDDFDSTLYHGIAQYELHLRYYVWAGRYIGHPFSYHTIGSSMACSAEAYLRFGGMNKNKAGEDFYFLQKIIPHGEFEELSSTVVYPSPRPSYRVPFGTGRAMTKYLESEKTEYLTYSLESFLSLKAFMNDGPNELFEANRRKVENFHGSQPESLKIFLETNDFLRAVEEINSNTSSLDSFTKRFFLWFDAFKLLKYLNFAHEEYFAKQSVLAESLKLAKLFGVVDSNFSGDTKELLQIFRQLDLQSRAF